MRPPLDEAFHKDFLWYAVFTVVIFSDGDFWGWSYVDRKRGLVMSKNIENSKMYLLLPAFSLALWSKFGNYLMG